MALFAQPIPKTSVRFFKLFVAAARIEYTQSPSQDIHNVANFSSKNATPFEFKLFYLTNWAAKRGMFSIIANRTLHCLSPASSTIAGRRDWDSKSIPITVLTFSILAMIFKRTSEASSFSRDKKSGTRCSIVLR